MVLYGLTITPLSYLISYWALKRELVQKADGQGATSCFTATQPGRDIIA